MMRLNRAVLLVAVASMASLIASIALIEASADWAQPTPIAGDPSLYAEIADAILDGAVPYIDVTVEHLPVMLVPILGIGALSDVAGLDYAALWPLVTIAAVIGCVSLAGSVGLAERYQARFAVAVVPMLPLIIYRLEVFVVLPVLAALIAYERRRNVSGSAWTLAGTLAKGWPIVLYALPFRRGAVRVAAAGIAVSVSALAIVATLPGFREGRAFTGIHAETIVGNLLLVLRHATGADLGLISTAGATYVEAPAIAVLLNAGIGVAFGALALIALVRTTDLTALVRITGLATLAIILASPLFSAQFVFWLTPFVPLLALSGRRVAFVTATLSMLVAAFWNPFEAWWAIEVAARNAAVVVLGVAWARDVFDARPVDRTYPASTSRRNLPV